MTYRWYILNYQRLRELALDMYKTEDIAITVLMEVSWICISIDFIIAFILGLTIGSL